MLITMLVVLASACKEEQPENSIRAEKQSGDSLFQIPYDTVASQGTVFPQIHAHLKGMVSEFIFEMFEDARKNFWFCTNHDGIIRYDGNRLIKYTRKSGLGGTAVRSLVIDNNGVLWFGTSGGLTKFDGNRFTNYLIGENKKYNEIWSLAIDKQGIIWVGTNTGAYKFDGSQFIPFKVPKAKIADAESRISPERIGGITIDSKGQKWFVTDGFGITKINDNQIEFFTTENGLTDNNVTSVFEDSKGHIWIGTYGEGVSRFDGLNFIHYTRDGIIRGNEVSNFCEDPQGNIWFSAEGVGVYRFDGNTFKLFTTHDGLATNTVQHIYADKKSQIWFCTWQGISLFDGKSIVNASEKEPWTK